MRIRASLLAVVLGLLFAVGCSNAATRCDVACTSDSDCFAGAACLDVSGGRACLPTSCSTCPIGDCELTTDGCGFVRCDSAP